MKIVTVNHEAGVQITSGLLDPGLAVPSESDILAIEVFTKAEVVESHFRHLP